MTNHEAVQFGDIHEGRRFRLLLSQALTLFTAPVGYLYLYRLRNWGKRAAATSVPSVGETSAAVQQSRQAVGVGLGSFRFYRPRHPCRRILKWLNRQLGASVGSVRELAGLRRRR